jgi:hypothetical protein
MPVGLRHGGIAMLVAGIAGCGDSGGAPDARGQPPAAGDRAGSELPRGAEPVELDPREFTTEIDNPYWPMSPGTRWTYRETDQTGGELRVVVTVSDRTKRIANGVTARVVRDTVTTREGELVEDTFDWYAQDRRGNVWYLGEDTAEFKGGRIASRAGSFEAGVDGAQPGIIMPAEPEPGMTYRQEYYAGEAEDNAEVLSVDEMAEVPFGQFEGVLLTKDTVALEPDVLEYKLYARDVGPVLILGVSGGPGSREELVRFEDAGVRAARRAGTAPLGGLR